MNKFDRVIILGSGDLPYNCAQICMEYTGNVEVVEIKISDGSFLEKKCQNAGIRYLALTKSEITKYLTNVKEKTLMISASSTYLVPPDIIARPEFMIINWHNALLPAHKGRNAECWAIYEGDPVTGITWHILTNEIDGGDIIAKEIIPITDDMTSLVLFKKQVEKGTECFSKIAPMLFTSGITPEKQPVATDLKMHYSKDVPNDGFLDPNWDYEKVSRFLRSMDYGGLMLLGPMKIRIDNTIYCFRKYAVDTECENEGFYNDNYIFNRDGHRIILKKLRKENNQ